MVLAIWRGHASQSDQPQPRSECWWRPEVMRKRMAQQIVTQGGAGGAGTGFLGGRNRERQQLAMRQRRPQPSPVAQHVPGGGAVAEGGPGTDFDGGGGSGFPVDGAHPQSGVATAGGGGSMAIQYMGVTRGEIGVLSRQVPMPRPGELAGATGHGTGTSIASAAETSYAAHFARSSPTSFSASE